MKKRKAPKKFKSVKKVQKKGFRPVCNNEQEELMKKCNAAHEKTERAREEKIIKTAKAMKKADSGMIKKLTKKKGKK